VSTARGTDRRSTPSNLEKASAVKSTPKKRKVLRHGAISFTGNKRRSHRHNSPKPSETLPTSDAGSSAAAISKSGADTAEESRDDQRLQKILAAAGVGSRRECEELILAGRIEVDGQPVTELGVRVDSRKQKITVDGESVKFQRRTYYAVNKPTGVLSTNSDPSGRIRVVDLIGGENRLFTVGRLDQHSAGLIIVTNDGELTQRLTHPKFGVPKVYSVQVAGEAGDEVVTKLLAGVRLEEGIAKAARAVIRKRTKSFSVLEMVLTEGRNREIRRMLAQLGHKVQRLTRIAVGPIRLGKLKPGQFRMLEPDEIKLLKDLAFRRGDEVAEASPHGKPFGRGKSFGRGKFGGGKPVAGNFRDGAVEGRRSKFAKSDRGSTSAVSAPSDERPERPRKFVKEKYSKDKSSKDKFGKDKFRKESAGQEQSGQRKFAPSKFAHNKAGQQRKFVRGKPAFGAPAEGEQPAGEERSFGKKRFGQRPGGRPGSRPEGRFGNRPANRPVNRPSGRPKRADDAIGPPRKERGSAHPLPFLKQGLVVDDDAPEQARSASRPPRLAGAANQDARPAKPHRKPLRRLKVRRRKPG
jgi:23S rRNA pseudouridine2605 synthase